ncbi:MAG: response regulator [Acidimicrobiales bacterium]
MAILVVDDSRAMRMIVMRELRKAGFDTGDVVEAENGAQALALVQAGGVELVLSDWNMPTMTGIELLRALRKQGNAVPFGFVTSEYTPVMHRDALDAGADFVVTKPFSNGLLYEQVEQALEGRRQADGLGAAIAPEAEDLGTILEELLGRPVKVTAASPPRLSLPGAVALYESEERAKSLLALEIVVASSIGAALSRIPARDAESFASEGALPEAVQQNLHEVLNVVSRAVPAYGQRWRLDELRVSAPLRADPDLAGAGNALWARPAEVEVSGYPSGRVGFVSV